MRLAALSLTAALGKEASSIQAARKEDGNQCLLGDGWWLKVPLLQNYQKGWPMFQKPERQQGPGLPFVLGRAMGRGGGRTVTCQVSCYKIQPS